MQRTLRTILTSCAVVGCLLLFGILARPLLSKALRHEVIDRYTGIAPLEEVFPALEGHIEAADWGLQYIVDPLRAEPLPTDQKLWGRIVADRDLMAELHREYEWEDAVLSAAEEHIFFPEWAGTQRWRFSPEFNETINGMFIGNMYYDGQDTLLFYGTVPRDWEF